MLDVRYVTDHIDEVRAALLRRSPEAAATIDPIVEIATRRRELIGATEKLQARRNAANQEMSQFAKGGDRAAFEARRDELKAVSAEVKQQEAKLAEVEAEMEQLPARGAEPSARLGAGWSRRGGQSGAPHLGRQARVRLQAAGALGYRRRPSASSTSSARPSCPARASPCCGGSARGWSAR